MLPWPLVLAGLASVAACSKRAENPARPAQAPPTASVPSPAPVEKSPPTQPAADLPASASNERHVVAGHTLTLTLTSEGDSCVVLHRPEAAAPDAPTRKLTLALAPPCHFLVWRTDPPARAGAPSDGVSVGGVGTPMAWRYKSAKAAAPDGSTAATQNATVVAVIGDALTAQQKADPLVARRLAAGLRCAPSLQGIVLTAREARLSTKRNQTRVQCVEGGLDEKVFWMLAHE